MMKGIVFSKKSCAALLFLVVGACAAITPALPSTDADGCYLISNAEELYGFAAVVNGTDNMSKDAEACGKLTSDITVNENVLATIDTTLVSTSLFTGWTPLKKFGGSFDGNGYSISGLYQYAYWSPYGSVVGFVGSLAANSNVVIKNLEVKDSYFFADDASADFTPGTLVSEVPRGASLSIEKCHVNARIIGYTYAGGLVGESNGSVKIEKSSFSGKLTAWMYIGGLIAKGGGYSTLTILDSHNSASFVLDPRRQYKPNSGGLVGTVSGSATIERSYNEGLIVGGDYSGGLVGQVSGEASISESYNVASVTGASGVGGLVGGATDSLYVANSYNVGDLSATGSVGGVLGHSTNKTTIINCFNGGKILDDVVNSGGVVGYRKTSFVVGEEKFFKVVNSYCPAEAVVHNGGSNVSDDAFKNGLLARLLHDYDAEGVKGSVWGQNVGSDDYPVLTGSIKNAKPDVFSKLSFVTFDGDNTVYPTRYQEGLTLEIPKIADSRYVYAWYDNPEFTGKKYTNIPATAKGDLTLYAKLLKVAEPPVDADSCYLISDTETLYGFAAIVNGTNGMKKDSTTCAKLTADIFVNENVLGSDGMVNLTDTAKFLVWTPMVGFNGTFDGQGHVISGLYFNDPFRNSAGLFETTMGLAEIKNLGLVDSYVRGRVNVGAIVGYSGYHKISISNCYNASHIVATEDNAGGLVGKNGNDLLVSDCYNTGVVEGAISAGGIVGLAADAIRVQNSHNTGTIRGYEAAGIVGGTNSNYKNEFVGCYNAGLIEGRGVSAGILGGVEGVVYISESFNKGVVGSNDYALANEDAYYAAGLVGRTGNDDTLAIANSYNVGDVNAGDKVAGGLVGYLYSRIQMTVVNSYNAGKLTADESEYKRGGILGRDGSQNEIIMDNAYYLEGDSAVAGGIAFTKSELVDGTLQKKLHDYAKDGVFGTVWNQNVGEDPYPLLKGVAYKLDFMVGTTVVKSIMVFGGTELALVVLPEKAGFTYEPTDLPNVMPEKDLVVYGKFVANSYTITVSVNDSTMGSVTGLNETGVYVYNATVSLKAVPAEGYEFSNWEDNLNARASRTITVKSDAQYVAVFKKAESSSSSVASSSSETSSSSEVSSSSETSSSSAEEKSSSSEAKSSSSSAKSSSSETSKSSSSSKKDAIVALPESHFGMIAEGRRLVFWNADVGEKFAIMDMQGRVIRAERVNQSRFEVRLQTAGSYIVRIGRSMKRVEIK